MAIIANCWHPSCTKWRAVGGMWDADDDCCERRFAIRDFSFQLSNLYIGCLYTKSSFDIRCTSDHPCTHGEGHCTSDSDCERNGYHICGASCIGEHDSFNTSFS